MKDLKKEFYKKFVTVEDDWERGEPSVYSNEELELAYFDDVDPEEIWEWFEQKFLEERKKTLEEVRVKVGNKSAKVIGKLNNRQYDYGLGVVRCVGILSEVISKITKRGK